MVRKKISPAKNGKSKAGTPIAAAQQKVEEEAAQVLAEMARYQKLIEDAPRVAAERKRRLEEEATERKRQEEERARYLREEALRSRAKIEGRFGSLAAIPDSRFELDASIPAKVHRLRSERNQGRLTFIILLFIFAAVLAYAIFIFKHGPNGGLFPQLDHLKD
ncbi:MAG TPA: hypothetical protein VGH90_02605 [Chthoniobacteraceae bacterium]|jgi:hypothetical protein